MKCSLGISNFLEEISSLSHSVVFLYFFARITEEGFLSLLAIPWNSAFRWVYISFSPLPFASLLFSAICKAFSDSCFATLHSFSFSSTSLLLLTHLPPSSCMCTQSCNPMNCSLPGASVHGSLQARVLEWIAISFSMHFFFLGMVLITASCIKSQTSIHSSSGTLSIRSNPLTLFVTSPV